MPSIKPRSILQLTVTGFLSVTGLLFIALVITSRQLDGLSEQNVTVLGESASALSLSNSLVELSTALDRNARQYRVLGDTEIMALYDNRRSLFRSTANELNELPLNANTLSLVRNLLELEEQASSQLSSNPDFEPEQSYTEIIIVARRIVETILAWSNERVVIISEETRSAQRMITIQGFLLVIAALVLAGVFTALITRPLMQIERAIGRLGSGGYKEEIVVAGPKDLVDLGKRLDWLRDRLRSLESQRSSFLRHVSHELKTPLAAIRESASLLDDEIIGELTEKQKEILSIQIKNTNRLQNLIDQLLRHHLESFSVIQTMPQRFDLEPLIDEVIAGHEITIRTNSLEIKKDIAPFQLEANREQLRVVFDNLLSNAIKYSPLKGEISISAHKSEDKIEIELSDNGPGIDPEHAEHIFEAFYQGAAPDSDLYPGSGLGLAIAKEYTESNGGSLSVAPCKKGAVFRLTLPGDHSIAA